MPELFSSHFDAVASATFTAKYVLPILPASPPAKQLSEGETIEDRREKYANRRFDYKWRNCVERVR